METLLGLIPCFVIPVFIVILLVTVLKVFAAKPQFSLNEAALDAEQAVCGLSGDLQTLITLPLLRLLTRLEATEEGRIANPELELDRLTDVAFVFLGDFWNVLPSTAPIRRFHALELQVRLLKHFLHESLHSAKPPCKLWILTCLMRCEWRLGIEDWMSDAELCSRADALRDGFLALERSIYQLANVVREKEAVIRGSDWESSGDDLFRGDLL